MPEFTNALDFFVGGVPPDTFFNLTFKDLSALVKSSPEGTFGSNTTAEVCLIGLAAHFEAFCKNQFAALVNICPQVLTRFCERRPAVTIEVTELLKIIESVSQSLGFLLAEQYDFGSAKKINVLLHDLLGFTAFSQDEAKKYARFLNDRNLLVHHGGIYTLKYERQVFTRQAKAGQTRVHFDSISIRREDFEFWARFVIRIAKKISTESYRSMGRFVSTNKIDLNEAQKTAIETFLRLAWTS